MNGHEKTQRFIAIARQSGKRTVTETDAFVANVEKRFGPLSEYQKLALWFWYYHQLRL